MKSQHSRNVGLTFSQLEAKHLSMFLQRMLEGNHRKFNPDVLEAAQEKLADARALALWLREKVALELQPREAIEVLEALAADLATEGLPPEAHASLAGVRDELAASLPRRVAVRT